MTYEVLKPFTDEQFKVRGGDGEQAPLHREAGERFIPAETNYPRHKVDALVLNGTLRLIDPHAKAEPVAQETPPEPVVPPEIA